MAKQKHTYISTKPAERKMPAVSDTITDVLHTLLGLLIMSIIAAAVVWMINALL